MSVASVSEEDDSRDQHEVVVLRYSFRVMIINPSKKSDYVMAKFDLQPAKTSPITYHEMKQLILSSFPAGIPQPDIEKLEFGYIKPGHGLRGKKEWVLDDEDLKELFGKCEGKKSVKQLTLWCYNHDSAKEKRERRASKCSRSKSPIAKSSKSGSSRYEGHTAKMAKVDEIYKQIHDTHGSRYTPEQKRAWAHMIEMGKHDSITEAPRKRFFQSSEKSSESSVPASSSTTSSKSSATISNTAPTLVASPGRRVSIRSECIDQLQKWHALLDCGAISKEQYDELQATILSDIRKL